MKDFIGQELKLGDKVVIMAPKYRNMVLGTIIKFTPQKVRVAYKNTWNYSDGRSEELIQEPSQMVKVNV